MLDAFARRWFQRILTRRFRIPVVRQMATTDCAAAALTAVLRYHGIGVTLFEVQQSLAPGRDGVSAGALLRLAKSYGLQGRGVRCEPGEVTALPRASVLFWRPKHFVVFDRLKGRRVDIVDPACGRRSVPEDEFNKAFAGVALLFEPPDVKVSHPPRPGAQFRPAALLHRAKWVIARVVLIALLAQSLGAFVPLVMGALIDRVVPRADYSLLWLLAALFAASQGEPLWLIRPRAPDGVPQIPTGGRSDGRFRPPPESATLPVLPGTHNR